MATSTAAESRALALPPGTYAYLQDATSGKVQVIVGPGKINIKEDQDIPIRYRSGEFEPCGLGQARCNHIRADKTQYVVLHNPAFGSDGKLLFPARGTAATQDQPQLNYGETVNIPGNISFALWPEQSAEVVTRHELDYNQYLLVRVIDGVAAKKNWAHASVQTVEGETAETAPDIDFTTGALNIVKGTQYKYFIPCTGLEVLREVHHSNVSPPDEYVREAISLENMQFCILLDQNGSKRYERGPQVVFPKPTEAFWINEKGDKIFRAYELSERSGVYVMVTTDYTDKDTGVAYKAGQKLFITGKDVIYYPRAEHAVIKYGEHARHYATAVPPGEGRYVLNRLTGKIRLVIGPDMILLNPELEVFVRRVMTPVQCTDYWPGNTMVLQHNLKLSGQAAQGQNYVEDEALTTSAALMSFTGESASFGMRGTKSTATPRSMPAAGAPTTADVVRRGTSYTEPRTITLNTKLDGAVVVDVWPGYAVTVVDKRGGRKVVQGHNTVILEYDETLEVLQLSTGKPKNTDHLERTVYLNVLNNKVSDGVVVHTADHVEVQLKLSYRVNFEGDPAKWFSVSNYVKLMCDHCRSILKGAIRKQSIKTFYADPVSVIRDLILGASAGDGTPRKGMSFEENGMRILDVDILGITIANNAIGQELDRAQYDALTKTLQLENKTRELEMAKQMELLTQQSLTAVAETDALKNKLALATIEMKKSLDTIQLAARIELEQKRMEIEVASEAITDFESASELAREKATQDQQLAFEQAQQALRLQAISAETQAVVDRFNASGESMAQFAATIADAKVREAFIAAVVALNPISGGTFIQTIEKALPGLGGAVGKELQKLAGNAKSTIGAGA